MRKDSDDDCQCCNGQEDHGALERFPVRSEDADKPCTIDVRNDKFPFAIVWTPIPCITWFLPFVGHMVRRCCSNCIDPSVCNRVMATVWLHQGIADSAGAIHDFAGPYYIGYDDMAFGRPTRYLILDPKKISAPSKPTGPQSWNAGLETGNAVYRKRMHNLWCVDSRCL